MVTVIIPNFNHSKYLVERIESVLNQSYQDFELIILDDHSTDNSREVIERYRTHDKVSHIIYNDENSGSTFKQWNRGFELAKGEYIWIAESDDTAELTMLEECVTKLEEDSCRVMCYCDSNFIDAVSQPISKTRLESLIDRPIGSYIEMNGLEFIRCRMLRHNYIYNASMAVFRRDVIDRVRPIYKSFRGCGDWLFWGEIAAHGNVVKVCKRLNNFRQHTSRTTNKLAIERVDRLESAEVLTEILSLYVMCAGHTISKRRLFKTKVKVVCTVLYLLRKTTRRTNNPDIIERVDRLRDRIKRGYKWYNYRGLLRISTQFILG